jgi:hypothetical protein
MIASNHWFYGLNGAEMLKSHHKWSVRDDAVAYYLYRFGENSLPLSTDRIGEKLGMGRASLVMRIANFRSLDGGDGLCNWAKQSEEFYHAHKAASQEEMKALVLPLLT